MRQFVCTICGYIYDEEKGIPASGITPGTKWEELPPDWKCPICKAGKSSFAEKKEEETSSKAAVPAPEVERELSPMEMSIICSNLARGCEKQYLAEQAEDFARLAQFFLDKAEPAAVPDLSDLLALIDQDLNSGFPYANQVSKEHKDRGAQRALVWSEKVTRMLQSLLTRYKEEGDDMLSHTGVYICTICGFVHVGDQAPELCPVCKVPGWKFEKVERRTTA